MRIERVNPRHPEPSRIREAVRALRRGELVIFPTETVYGLGANALNRKAVRAVFRAKGRPRGKPLIVLISKRAEVSRLAQEIPPVARRLMRRFWPGPLTLIFKRRRGLPPELTGFSDTIAIRLSPHPVARALVRMAGVPITAPSANRSGKRPPRTGAEALRALGRNSAIALILDAGKTPIGIPSTILDLTQKRPRLLRTGPLASHPALQRILTRSS